MLDKKRIKEIQTRASVIDDMMTDYFDMEEEITPTKEKMEKLLTDINAEQHKLAKDIYPFIVKIFEKDVEFNETRSVVDVHRDPSASVDIYYYHKGSCVPALDLRLHKIVIPLDQALTIFKDNSLKNFTVED